MWGLFDGWRCGEWERYHLLSVLEHGVLCRFLKNVWYLKSGSPTSSQILNSKVASSGTFCQNECLHFQAEDIASHAEEEDSITRSPLHPGQYILKLFCIRVLLLLCGSLPSTPLVWASLVTGATGRGVAFPQKSSVLNKSPNIAGDFVSFSTCGQLWKTFSFPAKKTPKKRKWSHNGPLAACKSSFAATWLGPLLIPSPPSSSISPFPRLFGNPSGLPI